MAIQPGKILVDLHQKHGLNTEKSKMSASKTVMQKIYKTTIHVQITDMFSWLHGVKSH